LSNLQHLSYLTTYFQPPNPFLDSVLFFLSVLVIVIFLDKDCSLVKHSLPILTSDPSCQPQQYTIDSLPPSVGGAVLHEYMPPHNYINNNNRRVAKH